MVPMFCRRVSKEVTSDGGGAVMVTGVPRCVKSTVTLTEKGTFGPPAGTMLELLAGIVFDLFPGSRLRLFAGMVMLV